MAGDWPQEPVKAGATEVQALLGKQLAQQTGWKVGDVLPLKGASGPLTVKISGVLSSGGEEEGRLVLPLAAVQSLLGLPGKVQAVRVSALTVPENELSRKARDNLEALNAEEYDLWYCTAYVSSIAHQLEEAISGSVVRPIWQVAASEGVVIEKIQLLLAVVTLAALIAAAMGIASLMTSTIMERAKEIGLMKALGARQWQILMLFYLEAAISGLMGGGRVSGWLGVSQNHWADAIRCADQFRLDGRALCVGAIGIDSRVWHLVPRSSYYSPLPGGGAIWPVIIIKAMMA